MTNPRFLELAKRLKNDSVPNVKTPDLPRGSSGKPPQSFPTFGKVTESFIFSYDGQHKDFFQELIRKSNETFAGTRAEIPVGTSGEVQNMYILKRLALATTLYQDAQLKSCGLYPITPAQSEQLLKDGKLPEPGRYWEDLGLILYDRSENGYNPKEAKALYDSLSKNISNIFGSGKNDKELLEERLIISNAGLEKDSSMPHGVKFVYLPGLTSVVLNGVLHKAGQNYNFEGYGDSRGLPIESQLGKGSRTLYLPDKNQDIGLRVLIRNWDLDLGAWSWGLVSSYAGGRVNFAPQGSAKI